MGLRFGMRLHFGPFSVSASTGARRRRRRAAWQPEGPGPAERKAAIAAAAAARRAEIERFEHSERIARMSPAEFRQHLMDTIPGFAAEERRKEAALQAQVEADLQRMKSEPRSDS